MNPTQLQTTLAPLVATISSILAVKFGIFDSGTWSGILLGVVSLVAIIWGGLAARKTALVTTVADLPEVKSVTLDGSVQGTTALSDATPSNVTTR